MSYCECISSSQCNGTGSCFGAPTKASLGCGGCDEDSQACACAGEKDYPDWGAGHTDTTETDLEEPLKSTITEPIGFHITRTAQELCDALGLKEGTAQEFAEAGQLSFDFEAILAEVDRPSSEAIAIGNVIAAIAEDPTLKDAVVLPEHYARFTIEPIRFICENNLNFFQGNILKYILRWDAKNGLEDLRKAERYLKMFIRFVEKDPDWWR
jgi:hypothetical protein